MKLIAVVMKAPTSTKRFSIATELLNYGFNNFTYKSFLFKDDIVKTLKVQKGVCATVNVIAKNNTGVLIKKGDDINIEQSITLPDNISAPVSESQILGTVDFKLNGEIIASCELISDCSVEKNNLLSMNKYILGKWLNLLRT